MPKLDRSLEEGSGATPVEWESVPAQTSARPGRADWSEGTSQETIFYGISGRKDPLHRRTLCGSFLAASWFDEPVPRGQD